jgi:hypothetical protein
MRSRRAPAICSIGTSADGSISGASVSRTAGSRPSRWWRTIWITAAAISIAASACGTVAAGDVGRVNLEQADDALCTETVTPNGGGTIQAAVDRSAGPGAVICVEPGNYPERVHITRGGTIDQPLTLRAAPNAQTEGFIVNADDVVIRGFSIAGQPGVDEGRGFGIYLAGQRLAAVSNVVSYPSQDGIGCEQTAPNCPGAVIRENLVIGSEGAGIVSYGNNVLIEGNDVSRSTSHHAVDADGVRFYGSRVELRDNRIHDISAVGYPPGEAPHTDCFQTFPKAGFAVADIVLEGNSCTDVDDQCLIADGPVGPGSGPPISFRDNVCANQGSQALLIRRIPGIVVSGNTFGDDLVYWGVNLLLGSTDAEIVDNRFPSAFPLRFHPVKVDASSQAGLRFDGPVYVGE